MWYAREGLSSSKIHHLCMQKLSLVYGLQLICKHLQYLSKLKVDSKYIGLYSLLSNGLNSLSYSQTVYHDDLTIKFTPE